MVRFRSGALLILVAALGCATPVVTERATKDALRRQLEALTDVMAACLVRGDGLGVAALYRDDAVLIGPAGDRVTGREAIDAYWQRFKGVTAWSLDTLSAEGAERVAVQRGRSKIVRVRDGKERVSEVEFLLVWVDDPLSGWRIAMDAYW